MAFWRKVGDFLGLEHEGDHMTVPTLPINPATGNPWTTDELVAAQQAIDAANAALPGDKSDEIVADATADAVQDAGGDAAITDPAERVALGLPPITATPPPPPVDVPPPPVPPGPVTLEGLSAHVDNLETRVTALEGEITPKPAA